MQDDLRSSAGKEEKAEAILGLLSAIVDSSNDAIVSKTLDGIITSWNRAAESMFGYCSSEMIGQSIRIIIPSERQAEEDYVLSCIRLGEKVEHFETVRQAKDGRRLDISLTVSPICDAQGSVIGASKIARDITVRKQLEREREELLAREQMARKELSEALSARDEFIAVAAHELRNPLNSCSLGLQLVQRVCDDPRSPKQIHNLVEQSRAQLARLSNLIDRLLDVSRARAGKLDLYRERFDLGFLLRDVVGRFRGEHPGVPISLDLDSGIKGTWDLTRIDQAATNLISNAIKYGAREPVAVSAHRNGNEPWLTYATRGWE
jgi:PAS domain S-box-containing protein